MIPSGRFSPAAIDQLIQYLIEEYRRAKSDRAEMEDNWIEWQRLYRAKAKLKTKTFPFKGSSNVVVSLIANDVDTIYARIMSTIHASTNLWSCKAYRADMTDFATAAQDFLEWAQEHEVKPIEAFSDAILEMCKLGTGVVKTRYNRESRKVYEFREMPGGQNFEQQTRVLLKDSPTVNHVRLANFYVPASATDLETATWCAELIPLTWAQLVNRANAGIYMNVQALQNFVPSNSTQPYDIQQQKADGFQVSRPNHHEIMEFWLDWDVDGDGEQEAIVLTLHVPTRTLLRIDFNPFLNQQKPYDVARYMRVEGRFYGIGISEMLMMAQEEATTLHNQRIDNGTIANAQVIKVLKSGNIKENEAIYPGRILFVDSMDEIQGMSLGVNRDTTIQDEELAVSYGKQRTGVNDFIAGNSDPSTTYSSATIGVQQLTEGAKRFDQTVREVRRMATGSGQKVIELYQQFNQGGKIYSSLGQKTGELVTKVLQFPTDLVRTGMLVDLTATSASYNKEVQIRKDTIITQMVTQYYQQLLGTMQIAVNPQAPPALRYVAMQAAIGGSKLLKNILQNYGELDADDLLPDINQALQLAGLQPQQGNPQLGPGQGSQAADPGLGGQPGMANMQQGMGGAPGFGGVQAQGGGQPQGYLQAPGAGPSVH